MTYRSLLAACLAVALALIPGTALGHNIVGTPDILCGQEVFTATGADFDVESNSPVTISGPDGYSESADVPSSDWTLTFPLGPDGTYSIDWPNSGSNGPVEFTVECQTPTPTSTPTPTPPTTTPSPTVSPAPTPSATPTDTPPRATTTPTPLSPSLRASCETLIVQGAPDGWTLLVVTWIPGVAPDQTFGPFVGASTEEFPIAPNHYGYAFLDEQGQIQPGSETPLTVEACPTPRVTPPPTDTADVETTRGNNGFLLLAGIFAIVAMLAWGKHERRPRR